MITERRIIDRIIHNRRKEITRYDQKLREFRLTDYHGDACEETRTTLIDMRSKLSAEQGYDKAFARRSDKNNRKPIQIHEGIATRIT